LSPLANALSAGGAREVRADSTGLVAKIRQPGTKSCGRDFHLEGSNLAHYAACLLGRPGLRRIGNSSTGCDRYPSGSATHACSAPCDHAQARPPRCTGAGKRPAAMRRYRVGRLSAVMRRTSRIRKNAGVARTCTMSAVGGGAGGGAGAASDSSMRSANCCGARL
jgi:hypothetical protein